MEKRKAKGQTKRISRVDFQLAATKYNLMNHFFVNLKRFDVPRSQGGVCPMDDPALWIESVLEECMQNKLGELSECKLIFFLPESLLIPANRLLARYPLSERRTLSIGSQYVYRKNIEAGKNFGAFTTSLPAKAVANMGCSASLIGHSEERLDKFTVLTAYDPGIEEIPERLAHANGVVNELMAEEARCAFGDGLDVVLCIGETEKERGEGPFETQQARIESVLAAQLEPVLALLVDDFPDANMAIGYEPRWAIGPGKTPPDSGYIAFVADFVKATCRSKLGKELPVVYGGGLKEENAAMLSAISNIDGGLIALTKFTGEIGFEASGLKAIIEMYTANNR